MNAFNIIASVSSDLSLILSSRLSAEIALSFPVAIVSSAHPFDLSKYFAADTYSLSISSASPVILSCLLFKLTYSLSIGCPMNLFKY